MLGRSLRWRENRTPERQVCNAGCFPQSLPDTALRTKEPHGLGVWHLYEFFPLAYSQLSQSLPSGSNQLKNLPAMKKTWVPSLGQEDSLEKGMATHSSIFVWRIPWTEEPGRLQSMGSQRVHD